ncbi:MAG: protein-glutamate O-methyltransferase CheR [Polyangiales bacterium]
MNPRAFARIRKLVHEATAIVLEDGKEYLVEARLAPIAQTHGFENVEALCLALSSLKKELLAEVLDAMTTNETSFFRDHHPFEALRRVVIPDLIDKRGKTRTLRVWCAACSSGQEPYSLAMLLDEHFPQLNTWRVQILATDVSKTVLSRACSGRYRQIEVNRGLSASLLVKYFVRDGLEWEIRPELKRLVKFAELNLIGTWPPMDKFDLVILRNVLIYFDQTTKQTLLERVRRHLRYDGYLMLGGSETTPPGMTTFERLPITRAGLYKATTTRPSEASRAG